MYYPRILASRFARRLGEYRACGPSVCVFLVVFLSLVGFVLELKIESVLELLNRQNIMKSPSVALRGSFELSLQSLRLDSLLC